MAENKNSVFNMFGQAKDIKQEIGGNTSDSHDTQIRSDIEFVIKDISGKIGDLSLTPQDSLHLAEELKSLENAVTNPAADKTTTKTILQNIAALVAKSRNVVVSAGIGAALKVILERLWH